MCTLSFEVIFFECISNKISAIFSSIDLVLGFGGGFLEVAGGIGLENAGDTFFGIKTSG